MSLVSIFSALPFATGFLHPRASRSLASFHEHLLNSKRILVLLGTGLSESSGLTTHRIPQSLRHTCDKTQLSTPAAFLQDPISVWKIYLARRKEVEEAKPNPAHYALAELANANLDLLTITLNVDDLSEKAGHPEGQLHHLYGSLFDIRCTKCGLHLSGAKANEVIQPLLDHDLSTPLQPVDLPSCPTLKCNGFVRPGVVWITESPSKSVITSLSAWIDNNSSDSSRSIDTMIVIGTSARAYPTISYIERARKNGARVAAVDVEKVDPSALGLEAQDWYFPGDAALVVPELLRPVLGISGPGKVERREMRIKQEVSDA